MKTSALRWRLRCELWTHSRLWEDETMVYNPCSGETHCLNELSAGVLRALADRPLTEAEVADLLGARSATASGAEEMLRQFGDLGLIELMTP